MQKMSDVYKLHMNASWCERLLMQFRMCFLISAYYACHVAFVKSHNWNSSYRESPVRFRL